MLDALKKKLAGVPESVALTELQANFDAFQAEANGLLVVAEAQISELNAQLQEAQAALEAANAQIEQLQAAAQVAEDAAAQAAAAEAALRVQARTDKLVAAVGTEKAPALLAAFEDMDDAKFDSVLAAMQGQIEAEAKSAMFVETGAAAEVIAPVENETLRILQERYKQN
jgi:hypothetical protein